VNALADERRWRWVLPEGESERMLGCLIVSLDGKEEIDGI
jgi:hypothetical protein